MTRTVKPGWFLSKKKKKKLIGNNIRTIVQFLVMRGIDIDSYSSTYFSVSNHKAFREYLKSAYSRIKRIVTSTSVHQCFCKFSYQSYMSLTLEKGRPQDVWRDQQKKSYNNMVGIIIVWGRKRAGETSWIGYCFLLHKCVLFPACSTVISCTPNADEFVIAFLKDQFQQTICFTDDETAPQKISAQFIRPFTL
jgi:hypothetical protein